MTRDLWDRWTTALRAVPVARREALWDELDKAVPARRATDGCGFHEALVLELEARATTALAVVADACAALREFTHAEVVEATGLNAHTVRDQLAQLEAVHRSIERIGRRGRFHLYRAA